MVIWTFMFYLIRAFFVRCIRQFIVHSVSQISLEVRNKYGVVLNVNTYTYTDNWQISFAKFVLSHTIENFFSFFLLADIFDVCFGSLLLTDCEDTRFFLTPKSKCIYINLCYCSKNIKRNNRIVPRHFHIYVYMHSIDLTFLLLWYLCSNTCMRACVRAINNEDTHSTLLLCSHRVYLYTVGLRFQPNQFRQKYQFFSPVKPIWVEKIFTKSIFFCKFSHL